jgi:hypothetical protein
MAKPVWVTRAGTLGKLEEGIFYELLMEAYDPDGGSLHYEVIAGYMPPGLVMTETDGIISGTPKDLYYVRGVPTEVTQDMTSTFCCRLTSTDGKISDRTFSITITGQDAPTITTPEQELARVFDGSYVSIQLQAEDLDNEPISWSVSVGELPPGLVLNASTGKITGYVEPVISTSSAATVGWDAPYAGWEEYLWQHGSADINQNYQFTIEITDGKEYAQKTYNIYVLAKTLLRADLEGITADDTVVVTADMSINHIPALLTEAADLGIYEHDNYFAFQFEGVDFDYDTVKFGIVSSGGGLSIPAGLTINPDTGWMYGYIDSQIAAQVEYDFAVYAYKANDTSIRSALVYFTITVVGDLANAIIWKTSTTLSTIKTGSISELAIESTNQVGLSVNYSLYDGSLPEGLALLNNGLIIGRVDFEYTSFDAGTTTFDNNVRELGARLAPLTIDQGYTFTIRAASPNNELLAYRTFTVTVESNEFAPYESLYLRASPGQADKDLFSSITKNTDIIPAGDVYRNGDPYFGRAADARLLLLSGLNASDIAEGPIADTEYNNGAIINVVGDGSDFFKREVTTNGVRIVAAGAVGGQTAVPDAWLEKVGRMFELFTDPDGAGINGTAQRALIKNLSGDTGTYHAGKPTIQRVARGAGADYSTNFLTDDGIVFWNLTNLFDTHVQNDMVWYLNSTGDGYGDGDIDAQEVIEHVFHTLHMHGLDAVTLKMYPFISADWASGPLYAAMVEAYDATMWDPSGYNTPANAFKTDPDAFEVAAKEYLYLLNFGMFEYYTLWDGNSLSPEWNDVMRTPAGILANNPLGYALHNTYIAPVISKPSLTTIRSIFQDGDVGDPTVAGASGYVVSGLNASSAERYISALSINHYRKVLRFGQAEISRAYDNNQNVIYEVLYYTLMDNNETLAGSVSKSINLTNKINRNITVDSADVLLDSSYATLDGAGDRIVYPSSLTNMRLQLIADIGLSTREILPQWMRNRQADGSIIGWKPIVVLAYMKPGTGARALFNLKRRTDLDQKLISFDVDRYIWDCNLSKNYDATTGNYTGVEATTFEEPDQSDKYLVFPRNNIWA